MIILNLIAPGPLQVRLVARQPGTTGSDPVSAIRLTTQWHRDGGPGPAKSARESRWHSAETLGLSSARHRDGATVALFCSPQFEANSSLQWQRPPGSKVPLAYLQPPHSDSGMLVP